MKRSLHLVFLILLIGNTAYAETRYGADTLAAPLYASQIKAIPNQYAIRGFAEIFGNFYPVAESQLRGGRQALGVNLLWSDQHTFGDRNIPDIRRLSTKYEYLCVRHPGVIEITPFTEHKLNNPDKYLDIAQKAAPDCTIVNNPWLEGGGKFSKRYKNEIHGSTHSIPGGPYNFSYDGESAVDSNVEAVKKKFAGAERFYLWTFRENCRWSMQDGRSLTERIRDCAKPIPEWFVSELALISKKGDTEVPRGWLIKSHSERHSRDDLKGDKLLIISPVKGDEVTLKKEGKVVAKLPYYGPYQGGGYRYYYSDFGYKLGAGLDLFINGKKYGTINGGFRDGVYR